MATAPVVAYAEAVTAPLDAAAVLASGFTDPALAEFAADLLPSVLPGPVTVAGFHVDREGPSFRIGCAAGVVSVAAQDLARLERRRGRDRVHVSPAPAVEAARLAVGWHTPDLVGWRRPRSVRVWSARSRSRMVRRIASADWSPLLAAGIPVMVTLTYPGQWQAFAPSAAVGKRHLQAFRKRWARAFGKGSDVGIWKLEFQRRGAPHFHLLVPWSGRFGDGRPCGLADLRAWVAVTWNAVLGASGPDAVAFLAPALGFDQASAVVREDLSRGLLAGTAVDAAEGLRCRDPRRIAVYFTKHSAKTRDGKEYQHIVPDEWAGAEGSGRFWGLWRVECPEAVRYVDARTFVAVRRLLRRYCAANNRGGRSFHGGRMQGGWVAVNDGPAFLSAVARFLALADPSES